MKLLLQFINNTITFFYLKIFFYNFSIQAKLQSESYDTSQRVTNWSCEQPTLYAAVFESGIGDKE